MRCYTLCRTTLVLVLASLLACSSSSKSIRPPLPKGPPVGDVQILGNKGLKDSEIKEAIATQRSSRILFWEKRYLDPKDLETDRDRILTLYRMKGYFDAKIVSIQVVPAKQKKSRKGEKDDETADGTNDGPLSVNVPIPGPSLFGPDILGGAATPPDSGAVDVTAELDALAQQEAAAEQQPEASRGFELQLQGASLPLGDDTLLITARRSMAEQTPAPEDGTRDAGDTEAAESKETMAPAAEETKVDKPKKPGPVRVEIQVDEGVRYKLLDIQPTFEPPLPKGVSERVVKAITSKVGDPFDLRIPQQDDAEIQTMLQRRAYPWAKVLTRMVVLPAEKGVRLEPLIKAGPRCTFGKVVVEGLVKVEQAQVLARANRLIIKGIPYNQKALATLQQQLYDLQIFQTVNVIPTESSRGQAVADILIQVQEKPFRALKLGGGFTQELDWQQIYTDVSWDHKYLTNRLIWLNLSSQVGWAFSPSVFSPDAFATPVEDPLTGALSVPGRNGPLIDLRARVTLPDFKARSLYVNADARFRMGQTKTYGFLSPQLHLSLSRPIQRNLVLSLGLGLEQYLPAFDEVSQAVFETEVFTPSQTQPIRFQGALVYLEQTAAFDRRDNVLSPMRGSYAALGFQEAGLLGDFSFIKIQGEFRRYRPILPKRLLVAGRLSLGLIVPLAEQGAPPVLQFQTGGGSSLRGFGSDEITWYTGTNCEEASPSLTDDCTINIGGTVMGLGNLETRYYFGSYGVVAFADTGYVGLNPQDATEGNGFGPGDLEVAVGVGIRYRTSIGPLRLDFGYRLRDPQDRNQDSGILGLSSCHCALHIGIGEAF